MFVAIDPKYEPRPMGAPPWVVLLLRSRKKCQNVFYKHLAPPEPGHRNPAPYYKHSAPDGARMNDSRLLYKHLAPPEPALITD